MRKNNDGYALVLVLVVMVVMCLVAVALMTASLKNLTTQQTYIERMQAQYEAAGEVEKKVAAITNITYTDKYFNAIDDTATATGITKGAKSTATDAIETATGITITEDDWIESNGMFNCVVSLTVTKGTVQIDYTLLLESIIVPHETGYMLNVPSVSYLKYEINHIVPGEEPDPGSEGGDTGG